MPDIEIFGPVSAGAITEALRSAPYANEITLIRNSKTVSDIQGRAVSFVRFLATPDTFSAGDLKDLIGRLQPIVSIEVESALCARIEMKKPVPVPVLAPEGQSCS